MSFYFTHFCFDALPWIWRITTINLLYLVVPVFNRYWQPSDKHVGSFLPPHYTSYSQIKSHFMSSRSFVIITLPAVQQIHTCLLNRWSKRDKFTGGWLDQLEFSSSFPDVRTNRQERVGLVFPTFFKASLTTYKIHYRLYRFRWQPWNDLG